MPFPQLAQPYTHKQPQYNTIDSQFEHCVKYAAQHHLDGMKTHKQWATALFGYENSSTMRLHIMTQVHDKFSIYFIREDFSHYALNTELIVQNYSQWFKGGTQSPESPGSSRFRPLKSPEPPDPAKIVLEINHAVDQEINQCNVEGNKESYRIIEWKEHPYKNKYIYAAQLKVNADTDLHLREGLQVRVSNGYRTYTVEVIEYDYVAGILFCTSKTHIPANYSSMFINVDNSFILAGLKNRIVNISQQQLACELPIYKFLNKTTEQLATIGHQPATESVTAGLDEAQLSAFNAALDHDITFIWGPPVQVNPTHLLLLFVHSSATTFSRKNAPLSAAYPMSQ